MGTHILTVFFLLFAFLRITDGFELAGYDVKAIIGDSFIQRIVHDENFTIFNCYLQYKQNSSSYTIELELDKPQEFPPEIIYGKRLNNLRGNICGIKIDDHRKDDPVNMALYSNYTNINGELKFFEGNFIVKTNEFSLNDFEVQNVTLGSSTSLDCSGYYKCTLVDPEGNEVANSGECKKTISHIKISQIGNWTCYVFADSSVEMYQYNIELRLIGETSLETWYKEEKGFGLIGCQNGLNAGPIDFCQFVSPRNDIYTVFKGSDATERYSSVGTDYETPICQIEFKLPLLPHEIGNWMCLFGMEIGSYVEVYPPGRVEKRAVQNYAKRTILYVELGVKLDIVCNVPYATSNCYIKSPTKEYVYGGDANSFRLGQCKTSVTKSDVTHLGIWSCHVSQPESAEDEIIEIDVREHNTVLSVYKNVDANEEQSAELRCEATVPIQSCQYLSPSGSSYNVFPEKNTEGFDYVGRGLGYGDCGLKIDKVEPEHNGIWTCVVNNVKEPKIFLQDMARINVNQDYTKAPPASAAAIGIPVGIAVVAILLFSVVVYRRYRKKSQNDDARVSHNSNPRTSDTPITNNQTQTIYSTNVE